MDTLRQILTRLQQDRVITRDLEQLTALIQRFYREGEVAHLGDDDRLFIQDVLTLTQAITAISNSTQEKQVAQVAVEQIAKLVGAQVCSIFFWDQAANRLHLQAQMAIPGLETGLSQDRSFYLRDYPFAHQVLEEKKVVQVPVDHSLTNLPQFEIQTLLLLPLMAQDIVIGLVEIMDTHSIQSSSEQKLVLGQLLANRAAVRIEQTRLLDDIQQRVAGLEAVYRANLSLMASLDLQRVLDAILTSTLELVKGIRQAHIFLYENEILRFGAAIWAGESHSQTTSNLRPDELQYRVARQGQTIVLRGYKPHPFRHLDGPTNRGSIASFPLRIGDRVVGVMTITLSKSGTLTEASLRTLRLLGDQAAIAIENARLHDLVSRQALTDSLTGLPNRRALDERLEDEIRRSSRYQHSFALIMLDLNDFKRINDTYGHPAGDYVLQQVADSLREHLRDTDFMARYGGDEFIILLPETDQAYALAMVERLKELVASYRFDLPGEALIGTSISVGLAVYPLNAISASALLIAADQALYQSKAISRLEH